VDIENRYGTIIEPERSGKTISDICIAFGVSRETWYKWKIRCNWINNQTAVKSSYINSVFRYSETCWNYQND
jgi:transposase